MSIFPIVACVLLFLAAFGILIPRIHPGWLGMAIWCLSILLPSRAGVFDAGIEWILIIVLVIVIIVLLVRPRGTT